MAGRQLVEPFWQFPSTKSQVGMVLICCTTECVHSPDSAFGPHTACMKSRMIASKTVEFL